jgi:hypothetical protein
LLRASALMLLACLVLAGCTARQSRDQYEERLDQALKARADVTTRLDGQQLNSAEDYKAASKQITAAMDELDADPPPKDVEAAHDSMLRGMDGLATLLSRLGRCEALGSVSEQDRRACRKAIDQTVYDEIRNDFHEANTIYLEEGFSSPELGGDEDAGDSTGEDPEGGDTL